MQVLTAPPRDGLTAANVTALLSTAVGIRTNTGADLLDASLNPIRDLSGVLGSGEVSRGLLRDIHGACTLELDTELTWGPKALVRPWMQVRHPSIAGGAPARFYGGVYVLTTPGSGNVSGGVRAPYSATGSDRLYLLNRFVGRSYAVDAGARYLDAVRFAVAAAGLPVSTVLLDTTAEAATLPAAMTWPLFPPDGGTGSVSTWLRVINDLLAAVGYRALWCDESGYYRSGPYIPPTSRAPEWIFPAQGVAAALADARSLEQDKWGLPNQWTFTRRGATEDELTAGTGLFTYTDTAGVANTGGLIFPAEPAELDAADDAALAVQARAKIANDLSTTTLLRTDSLPWPAFSHADVYRAVDSATVGSALVQAREVTQGWDEDHVLADTTHVWEVLTA